MFDINEYEFILHEIKNHITLINCSIQMIEKQHPEVLEFSHWDTVTSGLGAMREFFQQSATLKTCKDIHPEIIPTNKLIRELKSHIDSLCSYENVVCAYETAENPALINVDTQKIQLVILNLVKNALEAMKNISPASLTFCTWVDQHSFYISIKDTGIGMDDNTLSSIYTPMFTTKTDGCGLGLPLCKQIINEHNGQLLCSSEKNLGTTFTIKLPII